MLSFSSRRICRVGSEMVKILSSVRSSFALPSAGDRAYTETRMPRRIPMKRRLERRNLLRYSWLSAMAGSLVRPAFDGEVVEAQEHPDHGEGVDDVHRRDLSLRELPVVRESAEVTQEGPQVAQDVPVDPFGEVGIPHEAHGGAGDHRDHEGD